MSEFESDSFDDDDDVFETTTREYEEIPVPPPVKIGPTHHEIDYNALETYVYPVNFPIREYQFEIVRKSLYENVICAIPTGTGKTFISSCVMLNYYRWFPKSKLIFVAPTRPLVAQQIKAAVGMTGIPLDDVAILLDKSRKNRVEIWRSKRVFFSTPQVIENDLKAGFCEPKQVSLLIIDEAHRTKGNYAYNNIVQFLKRFTLSFRVMGLTATPGADLVNVQQVVDNLLASRVEIRTEQSPDIQRYMKNKEIEKVSVPTNDDIDAIIDLLGQAVEPALQIAVKHKIYDNVEPGKINAFKAMEQSQKVINNPGYPEGLKWYLYFILQLLCSVGQMLRRLKVYGIKTFYAYFENKHKEFTAKYDLGKSTNKIAADFYYHECIKKMMAVYKPKVQDEQYIGHPKLEILIDELTMFFKQNATTAKQDSRVIIFTEMRESALEIVKAIDSVGDHELLKPHIFIGQSKEKEKFDDVAFKKKHQPKKRGKKKQSEIEQDLIQAQLDKDDQKLKKQQEQEQRDSKRTGSSENAQINGMTQKQQKQLINEFKQGKFNILVATSIGEEGLDIGEVDLIVCYDATSSPIKNIQRMGRTGRKRDGKVLLLLTQQEQQKFEQSMRSYEIVQQQISEENGTKINYHESARIIPMNFKPACEKKYIEENKAIIEQEEEDAIIKMATQAMNNKNKKSKGTKQSKQAYGIETLLLKPKKKFFMPDNVETGFKNVSKMVRRKGAPQVSDSVDVDNPVVVTESQNSDSSKKRNSDIMDFLDSSDESENEPLSKKFRSQKTSQGSFREVTPKSPKAREAEKAEKGESGIEQNPPGQEFISDDFNSSFSSLADDDILIEKVVKKDIGKDISSMIKNTFGALGIRNNKVVTNTLKRRTLGVKRSTQIDNEKLLNLMNKHEEEELKKYRKEQEMFKKQPDPKNLSSYLKQTKDQVFNNKFSTRSGFVSQKQESDLYTRFHDVACCNVDLVNSLGSAGNVSKSGFTGKIQHSTKSSALLRNWQLMTPDKNDGYRELRKLVIEQRKTEMRQKKGGSAIDTMTNFE